MNYTKISKVISFHTLLSALKQNNVRQPDFDPILMLKPIRVKLSFSTCPPFKKTYLVECQKDKLCYQNGGFMCNIITTLLHRIRSISTYCDGIVNCGDNVSSLSYRENSLLDCDKSVNREIPINENLFAGTANWD